MVKSLYWICRQATRGWDGYQGNKYTGIGDRSLQRQNVCGMTFTCGGLHITSSAEVLHQKRQIIPGLYATGEIVGGLWHENYPSGGGRWQVRFSDIYLGYRQGVVSIHNALKIHD